MSTTFNRPRRRQGRPGMTGLDNPEPPGADPPAGWGGGRWLMAAGYPMRPLLSWGVYGPGSCGLIGQASPSRI